MFDLLIRGGTVIDGTGAAPTAADVAVSGGRVAAIESRIDADAAEVIDAADRFVAPGFVDVHTHYDGQATWDPIMAPSAWHGVTTVVMGNCGVGFAPADPSRHDWLIELMEGVEDIPGAALHEGITWRWETFPEYLDELERMGRTIDVAAQVPHGAVRAYVMGDRGATTESATAGELAEMARIVGEGTQAGAVAFSTNRLPMHTSLSGVPVPGTFADHEELAAIMGALDGQSLVEVVPAGSMGEDPDAPIREVELYRRLSLETGRAITFTMIQVHVNPGQWRQQMDIVERANAEGAKLVPQVQGRPGGLLAGWDQFNPFKKRPTYQPLDHLPLEERLVELRRPEVRSAILSEDLPGDPAMGILRHSLHATFPFDGGPVFEPDPSESLAAMAENTGADVIELVYDLMCERGMLQVFFTGYRHGDLEDLREMMVHPMTVVGLADGGAHCSVISDASLPTYMLQHWVRDRHRGPKLSIAEAVKMLTSEPAELYSFADRGVLAKGKRADINVIDLDAMSLHLPQVVGDLPTGACRLLQSADGYDATICGGEVTFRNGQPTGARPGTLIRS